MDTAATLTIVSSIFGVILTITGFLVIRSINQLDKALAEHDKRLEKHDEQIAELMIQTRTLQEANNIHLANISEKLEAITEKLNEYDSNIRAFYDKYELPLKKVAR